MILYSGVGPLDRDQGIPKCILTGHHGEVNRVFGTVSYAIRDLVFADALVHSRVLAGEIVDRQAGIHGVIVLFLLNRVLHELLRVRRQRLACKDVRTCVSPKEIR